MDVVSKQAAPAASSGASLPHCTTAISDWIGAYGHVAEWIRFADAKSAVVLTVAGALFGLLVPTLKPYLDSPVVHPAPWWPRMVVGLFIAWLCLLSLAAVAAFRCIIPFTRRGKHPALDACLHFHPTAIGGRHSLDNVADFTRDCDALSTAAFRNEIQAALLIDAHISCAKYGHVSRAIRRLALSTVFAFAYLIAIQF